MCISYLFLVGFVLASEMSGLSPTQELAAVLPRCTLLQVEQSDMTELGTTNFMLRVPARTGVIVPRFNGCSTVSVFRLETGRPVPLEAVIGGRHRMVVMSDHYGDQFYIGRFYGEKSITVYGTQYDNAGIPAVPNGSTFQVVKADATGATCSSSAAFSYSTSIYITCH